MRVDRARAATVATRTGAGGRDGAEPRDAGARFRACLGAEQTRLARPGAPGVSLDAAASASGLVPTACGVPAAPSPLGPAPVLAAAPPAGDTSAVRAAVVWIARCAVAAAAAPGELRLSLEDRQLGRIGIRVRVAPGRRVRVALSAPRPVLGRLIAEAPALAGDLAARGLTLAALRGE